MGAVGEDGVHRETDRRRPSGRSERPDRRRHRAARGDEVVDQHGTAARVRGQVGKRDLYAAVPGPPLAEDGIRSVHQVGDGGGPLDAFRYAEDERRLDVPADPPRQQRRGMHGLRGNAEEFGQRADAVEMRIDGHEPVEAGDSSRARSRRG